MQDKQVLVLYKEGFNLQVYQILQISSMSSCFLPLTFEQTTVALLLSMYAVKMWFWHEKLL